MKKLTIFVMATLLAAVACTGESAKKNTEGVLVDHIQLSPTSLKIQKSKDSNFDVSLNTLNGDIRTDADGTEYKVTMLVLDTNNAASNGASLPSSVTLTKNKHDKETVTVKAGSDNFKGKIAFKVTRKDQTKDQKSIVSLEITD